MNRELVWLMLPLVGLLSQLGGTYNKLYRRLGVPSVITLATWLFLGWSWWWPVLFLSVFAVATLPFTFKGSGLWDYWFNPIWIWILGYLYGLPSILISSSGALYAFVPMVVCGVVGTLSNVRATSKYFPWKFCEFIIWAAMAYCYALSIQLR